MDTKPTDAIVADTTKPKSSISKPTPTSELPQSSLPQTPITPEHRNFLATFLLALVGGYVGIRHFYLGNNKLGWLRAGLFIGGYLWIFLMTVIGQAVLSIIGTLAVMTAVIWAVVDIFYVYFNVKNDAEGKPLVTTVRDLKWAKILFWTNVGAAVIAFILAIIVFSFPENQLTYPFQNNFNESQLDGSSPSDFESDYRFDSSNL